MLLLANSYNYKISILIAAKTGTILVEPILVEPILF